MTTTAYFDAVERRYEKDDLSAFEHEAETILVNIIKRDGSVLVAEFLSPEHVAVYIALRRESTDVVSLHDNRDTDERLTRETVSGVMQGTFASTDQTN
jgi:hypothetical protein